MAATSDETSVCIFLWKIQNISHCWLEKDSKIISPAFIVDGIQRTKWSLSLYPNGYYDDDDIHLYLRRDNDCRGPNFVEVWYRLEILSEEDSSLKFISELISFSKGSLFGLNIVSRKTVFFIKREAFIPEDTLTIRCVINKKSETPVKLEQLSARTVFKVIRRSFSWKINKFSTMKPGVRTNFKDELFDFDLVLKEGLELENKLVIDFVSLDQDIKYFSFKTSIIDSEGKKIDDGTHEYFASDLERPPSWTLLFVNKLMENKNRNFPNDVLSLECEYVCSNGTVSSEFCGRGIISPKKPNVPIENGNDCVVGSKHQSMPALVIDMKSMYDDGIFSDMELRTSAQSFPVHKNILSARSPVFRRMFSNNMKEMNIGYVDITDLEDDTVRQMILYIYTDSLEDIKLEDAIKLYVAADKYEILSLRCRCSSFLKDSLCVNKACDILVLADLHHDEDLKNAVQDYILKYDKEVFGSKEWKHIMDTNSKLAADTMYRKYFPA